jgi:hypothetical protein
MAILLVAQKSDQNVIEGQTYELGGLIQNTENAVLFDCLGRYSLTEVFNVNKEFILEAIQRDAKIYYNNNLNIKGKKINTHYFYESDKIVYLINNQVKRLKTDGFTF